jgi:hypothetical protein
MMATLICEEAWLRTNSSYGPIVTHLVRRMGGLNSVVRMPVIMEHREYPDHTEWAARVVLFGVRDMRTA